MLLYLVRITSSKYFISRDKLTFFLYLLKLGVCVNNVKQKLSNGNQFYDQQINLENNLVTFL